MTATQVDGVEVIADEPALSGITKPDGSPIHFKQIRELLLADGRTLYGCAHCDFVRGQITAVRPHLVKHSRSDGASPSRRAAADSDLTLAQLIKKVETLEKVTGERDQWKARALKAERKLATFRSALRDG